MKLKFKNLKFDILGDEVTRFKLGVIGAITLVPLVTLWFYGVLIWLFINMNLAFFKGRGMEELEGLRETYLNYIFSVLHDYSIYAGVLLCICVLVGYYTANLMLRPFRMIGDYCQCFVEGKQSRYNVDFFVDLRILTGFSEYFFNILETAKVNDELKNVVIPEKYKNIHSPLFEKTFIIQNFFFMVLLSIVMAIGLFTVTFELHSRITEISLKEWESISSNTYFFSSQKDLLETISYFIFTIYGLSYTIISIYLHNKVVVPAFAMFATMRSFLRGNRKARVHLLGYYYVRDECRKLNKLLDFAEKNYILSDVEIEKVEE